MRPQDDDLVPMSLALRWQRDHVRALGSPVAGEILDAVAVDVLEGGPLASMLPDTVRFGEFPGLRAMAALHRLALERRAPAVALFLPTLGGTAPRSPGAIAAFRIAVVEALGEHGEVLVESLRRTPQTNETGRAALLRCALAREAAAHGSLPVRLWEIGASGGLNLRADHLPGLPGLEAGPVPPIVERRGCDLDPVDITTVDGRLRLSSYVWVDDVDRFARLARALDVAMEVPAELVRMDAADFVRGLAPVRGRCTVLWHSAMWVYLSPDVRAAVLSELDRAGHAATSDAPLLHVSWEWDAGHTGPDGFMLVVRRWDGTDQGEPTLLARGMGHGSTVTMLMAE